MRASLIAPAVLVTAALTGCVPPPYTPQEMLEARTAGFEVVDEGGLEVGGTSGFDRTFVRVDASTPIDGDPTRRLVRLAAESRGHLYSVGCTVHLDVSGLSGASLPSIACTVLPLTNTAPAAKQGPPAGYRFAVSTRQGAFGLSAAGTLTKHPATPSAGAGAGAGARPGAVAGAGAPIRIERTAGRPLFRNYGVSDGLALVRGEGDDAPAVARLGVGLDGETRVWIADPGSPGAAAAGAEREAVEIALAILALVPWS